MGSTSISIYAGGLNACREAIRAHREKAMLRPEGENWPKGQVLSFPSLDQDGQTHKPMLSLQGENHDGED